jgi:thiamine biosynthesis lipoprotein
MSDTRVGATDRTHVEHCMGTVFSIAIRDPGVWGDSLTEVVAWLHRVDELFSTYRENSDISRIRRGELAVADADPLVGEVLSLCDQLTAETRGYFTAHLPGGLDPTGLVKGWAIERASELLRDRGSRNHAINGGGDMQIAGEASPARSWRIGISDPRDSNQILTVVTGRDFAVATSGTAERGEHIVDPTTHFPARALASVTVVGRSLTRVDAYATAAFAMGPDALRWIESRPGYEAMVVTIDGEVSSTTGFAQFQG